MILPDSKVEIVRHSNKVVYDLGDKIAKVFSEDKPVSDVFNEALNLARINECGIRSPKAIEVAQVEGGGWALVTSKVPGVTLAEKMAAEPSRFYEYLEQFVDLQIEVHSFRCPLLPRQTDKYSRMINSLDQINASTRYDLLQRLDGMKMRRRVCHGDFNPTNVIVGEDEQLYVCDWAHATQGAPAADAAMTYLLFALQDKQQADAYLELYCERADEAVQVVRGYLPIVAASELARKRGGKNDEFLMTWIDVFDQFDYRLNVECFVDMFDYSVQSVNNKYRSVWKPMVTEALLKIYSGQISFDEGMSEIQNAINEAAEDD